MHDDMQYDPIQGQGQGHEPFWVGTSAIFNGGWQMATDSLIIAQYVKLIGAGFLIFVLVFVSRDFEVGSK